MTRISFPTSTDPVPKILQLEATQPPELMFFIAFLGNFEVKILKNM